MRIGGISVADREKVIRGLERFIDDFKPFCGNRADWQKVYDALALLKEQEARVVTTADFENNPGLDDGGHLNVWEEYKSGARFGWNTINVNDVRAFTDLRRYWTSRPTEEQRKAVPWNE